MHNGELRAKIEIDGRNCKTSFSPNLQRRVKKKISVCLLDNAFFWSIFDGIISYITPLVITEEGQSKTAMGLIYAFSSVFGIVFDIALTKTFKNASFRRLFLIMFAVCMTHPLILWRSKSIFSYLIAMAAWGLYYDLLDFGMFDFVGRKMPLDEHESSFGVIDIFRAMGHLVAPVVSGVMIVEVVTLRVFVTSWMFLLLTIVFFVLLLFISKRSREYVRPRERRSLSILREIKI